MAFYSPRGVQPPVLSEDGRTRRFVAEGTPFLMCPGLAKLERVVLGGMEIPFWEMREVVIGVAENGFRTRPVEEPLLQLDSTEDGTPVVLRSMCSNDGIWQRGAEVLVTGEWDESRVGKPASAGGRG